MPPECPICGQWLHRVASFVYWCARCGTLDTSGGHEVPQLVQQCRAFHKTQIATHEPSGSNDQAWSRLGIAQSIGRPEDRT